MMTPAAPNIDARTLVDRLVALFTVTRETPELFIAPPRVGETGRIFGGQAVAQAFMAAQRSVEDDKVAHSLHAYFLRPGLEAEPVRMDVARDRDGGSFASRRVVASQGKGAILTLSASFQRPEAGLSHAPAMPDVPAPETLPTLAERADRLRDAPAAALAYLRHPSAFDIRPVGDPSFVHGPAAAPRAFTWFRLRAPLNADDAVARALLAYFSDYALLSAVLVGHGVNMFEQAMQTASLDHAVWFHDRIVFDDWLLYATHGEWSGGGRGHATGAVFTRDGRLLARTAQEGLIRLRPDRAAGGTVPHLP